MKIAAINVCDYGSTGKIMLQVAETARGAGHEVETFSRKWFRNGSHPHHTYFGSAIENALHHVIGPLFGLEGSGSYFGTLCLIRRLKKFKPDVLHLHNLHGWYINDRLLFRFIKRNRIKTVWTLHDCWAFTGHCPYFDMTGCDKWQSPEGCHHCPSYRAYPQSRVDNARRMFRRKRRLYSGVEDMTLVTPSQWLAGLVKQSYLKEYPVEVLNNGIDLSVFRPTDSDLRQRMGWEDKYVVLGVAFDWGLRKGLDVFTDLSARLGDDYRILLVGVPSGQAEGLPSAITTMGRTAGQTELAGLYTAADLLCNPTREDNYPTVNMEAIACGTPVVTFRTGGSPEMLGPDCGIVVPTGGEDPVSATLDAIRTLCEESEDDRAARRAACRAYAPTFDQREKFLAYVQLYERSRHDQE